MYNVSAGKSMPEWLEEGRSRSLKYNEEFRNRVELVNGLDFPTSSQVIKQSPNGEYLCVTGVYTPQFGMYELSQLNIKFRRHVDAQIIDMAHLSPAWHKLVLLQDDRHLEFHTQGGRHYKARIPKAGRSIVYNDINCDLYAGASSSQVYRLNLDVGRFVTPLESDDGSGINVVRFSHRHQLLGAGGDEGSIEVFDTRTQDKAGVLQVGAYVAKELHLNGIPGVTALEFKEDGYSVAVGVSSGQVLLFDLRSSRPWITKDHHYETPVNSLTWHGGEGSTHMVSSDSRSIRIWDYNDGSVLATIESDNPINSSIVLDHDSGLLMAAAETPKVQVFYVPELAPAPMWASFLDSLTDELAEGKSAATGDIYDDYHFVTEKELLDLGLSHLIGTAFLRPYMHGHFMDTRLYNKVKDAAEPFDYAAWRKAQVKQKLAKARASRLAYTPAALTKVKVNKAYARQIKSKLGAPKAKADAVRGVEGETPLDDPRFASMFKDPSFAIDTESENYKRLHPSHARAAARAAAAMAADESDEDEAAFLSSFTRPSLTEFDGSSSGDLSSDAEREIEAAERKVAEEREKRAAAVAARKRKRSDRDEDGGTVEEGKKKEGPQLAGSAASMHLGMSRKGGKKGKDVRDMSFGKRLFEGGEGAGSGGGDSSDSDDGFGSGSDSSDPAVAVERTRKRRKRRAQVGNITATFTLKPEEVEEREKSKVELEQEAHLAELRSRERRGVRSLHLPLPKALNPRYQYRRK